MMAVPQLVNLFEELERPTTPPQDRGRFPSRIRLQLQTMFNHSRARQSTTRSSTPSSSVQSSPSSSYRSRRQPQTHSTDLISLFTPPSATSPPSSITRRHIRRQPSAIDIVLEAERHAEGPENIGLGLFEPRPRATSAGSLTPAPCSIVEFMNETQPTLVVLDGIIEVMESV